MILSDIEVLLYTIVFCGLFMLYLMWKTSERKNMGTHDFMGKSEDISKHKNK